MNANGARPRDDLVRGWGAAVGLRSGTRSELLNPPPTARASGPCCTVRDVSERRRLQDLRASAIQQGPSGVADSHPQARGRGYPSTRAGVCISPTLHEDPRLMISQRMHRTGPGSQEGTWVAAGAINDSGTARATQTVVQQGPDRGRVNARHVLTSAAGTITLETQAWLRPFPPPMPPRQLWSRGTGW